ncbi:UDP-N-acetylglucosamine 2-epimerase (non-hydrolyzing) [Streptomyces pluripotens]|uniref:UDP-N-acetylglucosamine 2-epimerase (Non-hydrolyzing) n=1 Tax=Streptomyces pluripotens TaxID=1355015 RepID=A0A221P5S1_9ACTN|nr:MULTISPECIES: UDP-N-acetylglucosamine 2-epimerase (non-hydrolyzing) [Streptomyces]ARP73215.1 UDP-N-acetylglucosamine 2-epimerase (non-hydrolyzing) [Streptomyces pluripotens]ASN27464.1 UDP-N-acetylglucosamine 2-epimerase (non-hydrolyzing) [Streptomyces pluripotens]MCH0558003.1 UDP-N-acetylglucosamine 2-epimerase (non-hydrolyzing) [Streptomyces sp. MUM 16J]
MNGRVLHVVGTRPNFVKAAPVVAALGMAGCDQVLVHTGQHYDTRMSDVFFRQLGLPRPDTDLGVGSGSHARQTADLLVALDAELAVRAPALVVVYGDVNSTLAAALAAAKRDIPVAHVEAGLRSFDMTMPEEVNRRLVDQLAELLFATSPEAIGHLAREGADPARTYLVGNPMIDTLLTHLDLFDPAAARTTYELPERYGVVTLHRPANVDDPQAARAAARTLTEAARALDLVVPLHPRGRETLHAAGLAAAPGVHLIEPLGYIEFMSLVRGAAAVITDSGGVQEETTVLGVPCLTLRTTTERPVTVTHGTNRLVTHTELVPALCKTLDAGPSAPAEGPPLWDGRAGVRIARVVTRWLEHHD